MQQPFARGLGLGFLLAKAQLFFLHEQAIACKPDNVGPLGHQSARPVVELHDVRVIALDHGVVDGLDLVVSNQDDAHVALGAQLVQPVQQLAPLGRRFGVALAVAGRLDAGPVVAGANLLVNQGLHPVQRIDEQSLEFVILLHKHANGFIDLGQ